MIQLYLLKAGVVENQHFMPVNRIRAFTIQVIYWMHTLYPTLLTPTLGIFMWIN